MSHPLRALLILSGLAPASAALAALVGLGVIREGLPWAVSAGAVGVALLPVAGLAGLGRFRPGVLAVALWIWPGLVLAGLPLYFPGERAGALVSGYMWLGALGGQQLADRGAAIGERVAALLGDEALVGTPPSRRVEPEAAPALVRDEGAAERALSEDEVVLPYEGEGRSLRVPVGFEGRDGPEERWMLFDTGATFSTLDRATLRSLGVRVPRDAPEVTLETAGGARPAQLVLLDRIWLGGLPVDGVTVAVCEPCAGGGVVGLLGLNVSGQFQLSLDHDAQELALRPRAEDADRHLDIGEWLDVESRLSAWPDGRMELTVSGTNRSRRDIYDAQVSVACPDERFSVTLARVGAADSATEQVSLPRNTRCPEYQIALERARW